MADRTTLPSGHWVELRDEHDLVGADYLEAMAAVSDLSKQGQYVIEVRTALLGRLITAWDYALPLPATPKSLGTLDLRDMRKLVDLTQGAYRLVMGISVEPDVADHKDEASPTGGSDAS